MSNATITFPMLGDWFSFSGSNSFTIFGWTFYWYGVIIAVGFVLAVLYCCRRAKDFGIKVDDILDMLLLAVPLGIIGARAYYVIFNFSLYEDNWLDIFNIRKGGLAIYGGVIGAAIAVLIICRVKKISTGAMLDTGCFGLLIGQAVGRWGNFINREAYGSTTDVFCRMGLTTADGVTIYVHPTFLYESLWNVVGFILLHIYSKKGKRMFDGQLFLMYVGWYGLGRFFIEGLRVDSLYLFGTSLRVSQLLAALSVLAVVIILFIEKVFVYHDPAKLWVNRQAALAAAAEASGEDGSAETESAPEEEAEEDTAEAVVHSTILEPEIPDEEIVDAPVVEPIEVVLHDQDVPEADTDASGEKSEEPIDKSPSA